MCTGPVITRIACLACRAATSLAMAVILASSRISALWMKMLCCPPASAIPLRSARGWAASDWWAAAASDGRGEHLLSRRCRSACPTGFDRRQSRRWRADRRVFRPKKGAYRQPRTIRARTLHPKLAGRLTIGGCYDECGGVPSRPMLRSTPKKENRRLFTLKDRKKSEIL
jgi:hypothetical protein